VVTLLFVSHQGGVVSSLVPARAPVVTVGVQPAAPPLRGADSPIDHIVVIVPQNNTVDNVHGRFLSASTPLRPSGNGCRPRYVALSPPAADDA